MKRYRKQIEKELGVELPKYLLELISFEKIVYKKYVNANFFSEGFSLEYTKNLIEDFYWDSMDEEDSTVSKETIQTIRKKLIPFATLDYGYYAFWLKENKTADELPIVFICQNDCYMELMAVNTKELLRLLSAGNQRWILEEDGLHTVTLEALYDYRNWLKNDLAIKSVETDTVIDAIIQEAQNMYQKDFFDWLSEHGSDRHVRD